MTNLKLDLDLVPQTCWFSNVRSVLTKSQWNVLRQQIISPTYGICQICKSTSEKSLECHEIWHYDDQKLIQKLLGMIALCHDCHMVKHMGFAQVSGQGAQALKHFMKVNGLKKKYAEKHVTNCFKLWQERSQYEWKLDISILQTYGIDTSKIRRSP